MDKAIKDGYEADSKEYMAEYNGEYEDEDESKDEIFHLKPGIIIPDANGRTNYEHAKACIDANPSINPGQVLVEAMEKGDKDGHRLYLPREDLYKLEDEYPDDKFYPSVPNLCEIEDSAGIIPQNNL